jgi:hypothetical protein
LDALAGEVASSFPPAATADKASLDKYNKISQATAALRSLLTARAKEIGGTGIKESTVLGAKGPTKVQAQPAKKAAAPAKVAGTEKVKESAADPKALKQGGKVVEPKKEGAQMKESAVLGATGFKPSTVQQPIKKAAAPTKETGTEKVKESAVLGAKGPTNVQAQPIKKAATPAKETGIEKVKEAVEVVEPESEGFKEFPSELVDVSQVRAGDVIWDDGWHTVSKGDLRYDPFMGRSVRGETSPVRGAHRKFYRAIIKRAVPTSIHPSGFVREAVEPTRKVLAQAVADEAIAKEAAAKFNGDVVKNADGKTWDIVAKAAPVAPAAPAAPAAPVAK